MFQFKGDKVRDDVKQVIDILRSVAGPLTIAQWIMTPCSSDPENRTYLEMLDAGGLMAVKDHARQTASRWAA